MARYLRRPERYPELSELVRPYCFRTLRHQAANYAKVPRRVLLTYEYTPSPQEQALYDLLYAYVNQPMNGYFSQDKKGRLKDTKGDTQADDDTYNTIMRDKEWLLSFDCPLRFIFFHSALKEGWDNPNVFQVCTLIEQKSAFTCRQKVGRGLRLCVNQDGERVEDKEINVLHVMANESFAEFAATLQKEIEDETGVKLRSRRMDLQDYRAKVSRYVNEHGDTLTIYKLMHNIPLSSGDYQELSRVLTSELRSHEDYQWEFGDTPFGLLIRKIRLRWIALGCVKLKMSFQREIN